MGMNPNQLGMAGLKRPIDSFDNSFDYSKENINIKKVRLNSYESTNNDTLNNAKNQLNIYEKQLSVPKLSFSEPSDSFYDYLKSYFLSKFNINQVEKMFSLYDHTKTFEAFKLLSE